jgi:hypothetical protein
MTQETNKPAVPTVVDESKLDPSIIAHFTAKEQPLVAKRDELLGQLATFKKMIDEVGGEQALKGLKASADKAAADAEAARINALSKEDLLKEQESKYAKLIGEKDEKITSYQQRMINKEMNAAITEALAAAEGNPKLLAHIVAQNVKASLNDAGEVVLDVTSLDGNPADLKTLVAQLRDSDDFAVAFKAPHVSGSGTRKSSDAPITANNPWDPKSLNITKQMEMIKADPIKATKFASMHGVKV